MPRRAAVAPALAAVAADGAAVASAALAAAAAVQSHTRRYVQLAPGSGRTDHGRPFRKGRQRRRSAALLFPPPLSPWLAEAGAGRQAGSLSRVCRIPIFLPSATSSIPPILLSLHFEMA